MLVKDRLLERADFSDADSIIADYILKREEALIHDSARKVAQETYVSASSVIRFCQKLGYAGYNDFREDYLKELNYLSSSFQNINPNYPFNKEDKSMTIAAKISALYSETIRDCQTLLAQDALQKAIRILIRHDCIYICTSGAQVGLCDVFRDKMIRIGKTVIVSSRQEDIYYGACYCRPENACFILISYTGESQNCIKVARKMHQRKLSGFVITSYGSNTLSSLFDVKLYISTREKIISNLGSFGVSLSVMYLLDILYAGCFNADYDRNLDKKIQNSKNYEIRENIIGRKTSNPILRED